MGDKPLVSVIIIFLNGEKFIHEAIESVFAQTYSHWELLLVDDGSTDASTDIALRYAEQYPDLVRYLEHHGHQNRGMSASRNQGTSHAKGEYIAFLDADDVWLPHKLAQQVAILESHPTAAMVYGPYLSWYGSTGDLKNMQPQAMQALNVQPDTLVAPPKLLALFLRDERSAPSPSGIMVRHEVIASIGGFEEAFPNMHEDQVFYAKVCLAAPVFVARECWYRYRVHPDSCCAVSMKEGQYHTARRTFLTWLEVYLARRGLKGGEVWKTLQKELFPHRHPLLHRLFMYARHPVRPLKSLVKLVLRRTLPTSARIRLRGLMATL